MNTDVTIAICRNIFAHHPQSNSLTIMSDEHSINEVCRETGWLATIIDSYTNSYDALDVIGYVNSKTVICSTRDSVYLNVYTLIK